jgi:hypothetical protein
MFSAHHQIQTDESALTLTCFKAKIKAPSPHYSRDRAMMAPGFVSAELLRPRADTGSIGEDRKRHDGTKTKPGRTQTVNNTG